MLLISSTDAQSKWEMSDLKTFLSATKDKFKQLVSTLGPINKQIILKQFSRKKSLTLLPNNSRTSTMENSITRAPQHV